MIPQSATVLCVVQVSTRNNIKEKTIPKLIVISQYLSSLFIPQRVEEWVMKDFRLVSGESICIPKDPT